MRGLFDHIIYGPIQPPEITTKKIDDEYKELLKKYPDKAEELTARKDELLEKVKSNPERT